MIRWGIDITSLKLLVLAREVLQPLFIITSQDD